MEVILCIMKLPTINPSLLPSPPLPSPPPPQGV